MNDMVEQVPFTHFRVQVDITDPGNEKWWDKYKYDIPVLHVQGRYFFVFFFITLKPRVE